MSLRNLRWYGPSLLLLITALLILFAGPGLARKLAYEHHSQQIRLIRQELSSNPTLAELSEAFKSVARIVEPGVVHIQVYIKPEDISRRRPRWFDDEFFRRFFGPGHIPPNLLPPDPEESDESDQPSQQNLDRYNVPRPAFAGSGWVYDRQGHIITNAHVVERADKILVKFFDGTERTATIKGIDPKTDIAVLKVNADNLQPATIASRPVEQGEIVFAFGSPFGFTFSMSQGIVSAVGRRDVGILKARQGYEDFIQTDAAINQGNSGGPLTNVRGEVVGMNTAIATRTGTFAGVGFAIPVEMVRKVANELIAKGKISRGYLGVFIRDLDEKMAHTFNYSGKGVLVEKIIEDGPAAQAGLQRGDIITGLDGQSVESADELRNRVADIAPGTSVKLEIFRNGQSLKVPLTVGLMPDETAGAAPRREKPATPQEISLENLRKLGLETVADMTPQIARRMNLKFAPGVVVLAVRPGSAAAAEGISTGTIITDVMGRKVSSVQELADELAKYDLTRGVRLSVRLGDDERFVFLELPKD